MMRATELIERIISEDVKDLRGRIRRIGDELDSLYIAMGREGFLKSRNEIARMGNRLDAIAKELK